MSRLRLMEACAVGACVLLALSGGCKPAATPAALPAPAVTVARPARQEVMEWDEYTGRLTATESVEVRARVSGLIVAIDFTAGSMVKKGDLLFEIDVRPFQAELDAKIGAANQAAAQVNLAEIELKRVERVPEQARTGFELDTATANLKQAQASLAMANALVESARLDVEWCRVTAPITGHISDKSVDPGNLITGGTGTGTLLTNIVSVDPIYCFVDVDERSVLKYARLAREGARVSARQAHISCFVQLADEIGFPHEGIIDFVDNRVDPATGTVRGRGVFSNADGWMLPGFFAHVRLPGSGRYEALLVPDSAVTTDQNQKLLMVVGPDNLVQPRPVKLGALFGEFRAIASGIGTDERVIINGLMNARPGAAVAPKETELSIEAFQLTASGSPVTITPPPGGGRATSAPSSTQTAPAKQAMP